MLWDEDLKIKGCELFGMDILGEWLLKFAKKKSPLFKKSWPMLCTELNLCAEEQFKHF